MNPLNLEEVYAYVNEHIDLLNMRKVELISGLTLPKIKNKYPYLFTAINITKASELIEGTLQTFLSSSEEKLFGDFLEDLAIFIAGKTTGGHKSTAQGMDLEYENKGVYHVVSIKSGPSWGNSSQHAKLAGDFSNAERRIRQSAHAPTVQKVLGICYGKTKTIFTKDGYIKLVGQNFWTFISNNQNLYIDIIEPVGYRAREHNETYITERDRMTNLLTHAFINKFCKIDGSIDWDKLIKANSGNFDLDRFFS